MSQTKSSDDEVRYWKERAEELERELEDFREQSQELERELEVSLEQADKLNRDLKIRCNKLQLDNETLKDKLEQVHKESTTQISELQTEVTQCRGHEEKLVKYIRELEQKNDDLERTQRAMYVSLGEFETKMNLAIERNALLESELDEKESLQAMVQRLKDEARDMKQEMLVKQQREKADPKKLDPIRNSIDSNKLVTAETETQTQSISAPSPMKIGANPTLSPPTRISAMNIVGDLLRKVGLEKWLCPECSRIKCCCAELTGEGLGSEKRTVPPPARPIPHPDSLPKPTRPQLTPPPSPKFQAKPFFQQLRNSFSLSTFSPTETCLPQSKP